MKSDTKIYNKQFSYTEKQMPSVR